MNEIGSSLAKIQEDAETVQEMLRVGDTERATDLMAVIVAGLQILQAQVRK